MVVGGGVLKRGRRSKTEEVQQKEEKSQEEQRLEVKERRGENKKISKRIIRKKEAPTTKLHEEQLPSHPYSHSDASFLGLVVLRPTLLTGDVCLYV